ncbi:MAG: hypothetical protein IKU12_05880 [Oscillospiraceae bacterium]|nr:hypothetical protein [Oscillospiraceae bacterium]
MKIEDLGLSTRTQNVFLRRGITTVEKLLMMESREFMAIRSFGPKGRAEIIARLEELGYNCDYLKKD